MRRYVVSEEEFLEAINEMERIEAAKLERIVAEAEENPHQFSERFLEWKEALAQELDEAERAKKAAEENAASKENAISGRMPVLHRFINTSFKKAAAVAVVTVGVLTLGFGMQSEAGEFALVKFFQQRFCDYVEIKPHEDLRENQVTAQTIETVYDLSWIPKGYEQEKEKVSETYVMQTYYNKSSGKRIKIEQYCVKAYFDVKEEEGYQEVKHEGRRFYALEGEDGITVVWYEDGYQFVIYTDTGLDETLTMAEHLEKR